MKNIHKINENIYITSDEEIKEGDWTFDGENPYKWTEDDVKDCLYNPGSENYKGCKKIILTTDQYLIKDGVQAIDDEFLEWFVKNPSCEEVEVGYRYSFYAGQYLTHYKIIIPIDEPKQIKCYCGHTTMCDCSPIDEPKQEEIDFYAKELMLEKERAYKQETLEEAAERYTKEEIGLGFYPDIEIAFEKGAKWQQERSYSEEEVLELILKSKIETSNLYYEGMKEWFEQYKKK